MTIFYLTKLSVLKNVSETRAFSNPTQGTQCGDRNNPAENQRLGEKKKPVAFLIAKRRKKTTFT